MTEFDPLIPIATAPDMEPPIVKQHAGSIALETETGNGTTFIVRLPLHPSRGASACDFSPAARPALDGAAP